MLYNESDETNIATFTKESAARKYYTSFYIHIQPKSFSNRVIGHLMNFTAGDVDYLNAKVYIKPFHGKKHIKVRSQIFLDGDAFSKVFSNEYDINSDTRWFKALGWGNTNFNYYKNNIYKWVIEIDGKTIFSQEFRMSRCILKLPIWKIILHLKINISCSN